MIKDIANANESVHSSEKEMQILREYFPSCFKADGSFDIERLAEQLKEKIDVTYEGYELKFLGKSYAKLLASLDTTTIIKPDLEHNEKIENKSSENIYISGDNLDGLKHLLKSYSREAKCIYIDPPYNTGKDDFAYRDTFNFSHEELMQKLGLDDTQAQRVLDLTKRGSSSHSAWLMFMYPRLLLARDIMAQKGVILISIDDNEQADLRLICDDIMGEENYLGTIIWKNATDNNPSNIAVEHEYVVVYAKSKVDLESVWKSKLFDIKDILINIGDKLNAEYKDPSELKKKYTQWFRKHKSQLGQLDRYKYIDSGGVYTGSQSVHNPGKEGYRYDIIHPVTKKPCVQPLMGYRFPKSTMDELIKNRKILFGEDENKIVELKVYARDFEDKLSSVFELDGRLGAYDLKELFPEAKQLFKNPKPVYLIRRLLSFILDQNSLVLDFFSGSSTTAQAVMQLNVLDNGQRKYILIQLPEDIKEGSEAFKLGYKSIDQIGIERIKRAASKIKKEGTNATIDFGFKHYTLCEANQNTLDKMEEFNPEGTVTDETILDDFGQPAVLTTWLVKDGYGFNATVQAIDLAGYTAYFCGKHLYLIDTGFSEKSIEELLKLYNNHGEFNPENIILFGYSFITWTVMEMLENNLKLLQDGDKNLKVNIDIRY